MLRLLLRNPIGFLLSKHKSNPIIITTTHLHFLHNSSISKYPKKEANNSSSLTEKPNSSSSLTVSYLINSFGLSPQSALSASKKITIKTTEKPDSVLNVLKSYGFTNTHITKLITKSPRTLISNPDTTIRPKLEFFLAIGFSTIQLTDIISSHPKFLTASVENRLKPNYELLRSILSTDDQIAVVVRRSFWLLRSNLKTEFLPNIKTLQCYGVSKPNIAKFITLFPRVAMQQIDQFKMTVESIVKMGFDPSSTVFVKGVGFMSSLSPSTWAKKVACYKSLGWSNEEVVYAFTKHPSCMGMSEDRIRRAMYILGKKMHLAPSILSKWPVLFLLSLEKRIIPRCLVLSVLASKGMVNRKLEVCTSLKLTDKVFLDKYVTKYADQFPEVLEAYKGEVENDFEWPDEADL